MMLWLILFPITLFAQLQNEDFSTVSQLEARGLTNAQARERMLHDSKVWVTANGLDKLLEEAIVDGDISGGARNANTLLICPDFENCPNGVDGAVTVGTGTSTSDIIDRTSEVTANSLKSYEISSTLSSTLVWTVDKSANFQNQQMIASCEIKTSRSDVVFRSRSNGANDSVLNVVGDGRFRFYEIPFVGGVTSQGFRVEATTTAAGVIEVDNCYLGKANPDFRRQYDTSITDFQDYTPATTGFGTPTNVRVKWRSVGNMVHIIGHLVVGTSTATDITISLPNNYTTNLAAGNNYIVGQAVRGAGASVYTKNLSILASPNAANLRVGNLESSNAFDPLTILQGNQVAGSGQTFSFYAQVPVNELSAERSTIVTQNTELTAKTANEFGAKVSSAGVVSDENFDWINGNCTALGSGGYTCPIVAGVFSVTPNCTATVATSGSGTSILYEYALSSSTSLRFTTLQDSIAGINKPFTIHCQKAGADYNKSATIVGKFENINSSELVKVRAAGNNGAATSGGNVNFTEVSDNYNAWSGTQFTPPKTSFYLIEGAVSATASTLNNIFLHDVALNTGVARCSATTNEAVWKFTCLEKLNEGQVVSIRAGNITLSNNTSHRLNITELPDTESIIKNLSTQKTECQTKRLAADVSTSGVVAGLGFNNLTIGKKYSFTMNASFVYSVGNTCSVAASNGATSILKIQNREADGPEDRTIDSSTNPFFTATATGITVNFFENATCVLEGNSTFNTSWATLCELPDTVVETTRFN